MSKKIQTLKNLMKEKGYDLYLVPSVDDHNNEYLPECWQYRRWISEFDGSAGDVLITLEDKSFLSTDGRYFSQAEYQLDNNEFTLLKQPGFESKIEEWLINNSNGKILALDPKKISIQKAEKLKKIAQQAGAKVIFDIDNLVEKTQVLLGEKVAIPNEKIFIHGLEYTGKSTESKINSIRDDLKKKCSNALVVSSLDDIAWVLNIRGRDIVHTPVAIAYLIVTLDDSYLYVDDDKLEPEIKIYLNSNNIAIKDYYEFYKDLAVYEANYLLDINSANYEMKQAIHNQSNSKILLTNSPITLNKASKNSVEINGAKECHKKDALAFIEWWKWMENNYQSVDEIGAGIKLSEFRAQQEGYVEDSFNYIVGFADHSALPHYSPTVKTNRKITDQNVLLIDSGGQYKQGTTDITRVLHFGNPTAKQKEFYTLVLKGHLNLSKAIFPKKTTGSQLDILARESLWKNFADFNHGTGHGVSSFLGVHEGPQRINSSSRVELIPGMIISNEPGVYFPGEFGIRIENLIYIKETGHSSPTGHGPFYHFENLTLIPYDLNLIEKSLLTSVEKNIINDYHSKVKEEILPLVDKCTRDFLLSKLMPIND